MASPDTITDENATPQRISAAKARDQPPQHTQHKSRLRPPLATLHAADDAAQSPAPTPEKRRAQPLAPRPPFSEPAVFGVRVMEVGASDDEIRWYLVRLVYRLRPGLSWEVVRRFREFDALASQLPHPARGRPSLPPLPPKLPSLLLSQTAQQRRVVGLQRFCQRLLSCPELIALPVVAEFFDLDFGLWRAVASSSPPPQLDRAQQRAAHVIQAFLRHRGIIRRRRGIAASLEGCLMGGVRRHASGDVSLVHAMGRTVLELFTGWLPRLG